MLAKWGIVRDAWLQHLTRANAVAMKFKKEPAARKPFEGYPRGGSVLL